eukprot:TRINITY_DN57657_c0_g1_i3.p1 TRINITY_DN57657_c0_g1~~TRINITY_DN57657_c0_g1_i3.p1  ORF type:complete len:270 (-),score=27.40 TRINITY_DN57657_c0_g1_i3:129-902(-)
MAEDKLNKSLEQLIQENREKRPVGRGALGNVSGQRGRGRGRLNRSVRSRQGSRQQLTVVVSNRGGVRKPTRGRTTGLLPRNFGLGRRTLPLKGQLQNRSGRVNPQSVHAALEGDGKWQHDLFVDDESVPLVRGGRTFNRTNQSKSGLLIVRNLNYDVSNEDVSELFSRIGPLRKFGVKFDRSGRSEGIAEVEFVNFADAQRAMKQYDGVMLDGKRMNIEVIATEQARGDQRNGNNRRSEEHTLNSSHEFVSRMPSSA